MFSFLNLTGIIRTIRKHGHENINKETNNEEEARGRRPRESREAEARKWQKELGEDGLDDAADAGDDTEDLNRLSGLPHKDDVLLAAIPVCGPYHTLNQFAYRVKLTPGSMKRGKASKQCVDLFLKTKSNTKTPETLRQLDLIKQVSDNDWVQVICADVKISSAGASKIAKKQKANRKKK